MSAPVSPTSRFLHRPAVAAAMALLLAAPPGARAQDTCATPLCHAPLLAGSHLHAAAEACDTCHEVLLTPHPQAGKQTYRLSLEVPDLCSTCHEAPGAKPSVHPPAGEGQCTLCHNPHSSDQPRLLTEPMKDLCGACHTEVTASEHPHGPVGAGDCTACHSAHESDIKPLLLRTGDDLCATCHMDVPGWRAKSVIHPALEGGCTTCHDPHGTAHARLLVEPGPQLCFQCHDAIRETVESSPFGHAAVREGEGCGSCHVPHASDDRKLLRMGEKDACLTCHATILTAGMTTLHGPIQAGSCTPCHDPHGSANSRLLRQPFPTAAYVPYTDTAHELCFTCHNRDLVRYPDTSFATNFRDGERNLHHLHVNNKLKGRGCRMCHTMHGSSAPHLLAESVPFGSWPLPIKFVPTPTGGGCSPGCHRPESYDRKTAVRRP